MNKIFKSYIPTILTLIFCCFTSISYSHSISSSHRKKPDIPFYKKHSENIENLKTHKDAENNPKAFFIIRFKNNATEYEKILNKSIKTVLEKRPDSIFDIVSLYKIETVPDNHHKRHKKDRPDNHHKRHKKNRTEDTFLRPNTHKHINETKNKKNAKKETKTSLEISSKRTNEIVHKMMEQGVTKDHIRINYQLSDMALDTEIHIFLR